MPRPKDKKYLTTEDQERIEAIRLANKSTSLRKRVNRKNKFRRVLGLRPKRANAGLLAKLKASHNAYEGLQTRPSSTNPGVNLLPLNLTGLGRPGGGGVKRRAIRDIKEAARDLGPIVDRLKEGGTKKKKALKKATAIYKSGGFIEPPIEQI